MAHPLRRAEIALTLALTLLAPVAAGCSSSESSPGDASSSTTTTSPTTTTSTTTTTAGDHQPTPAELFSPAITRVKFEIDYLPGQEPYTGDLVTFGKVWGVFEANVGRLFQGTGKTLEILTELSEMEELTDVEGTEWTGEQIIEVAAQHRGSPSQGETATYYLVWLPGRFRDAQGVQDQVLGVSLGATGVIAIFKEVIEGLSVSPGTEVEKYVEQATVIHEVGHAIGLVGAVPLASDHEDATHLGHCANDGCLMYYAVEGASGAAAFVQQYLLTQDSILFDDGCLGDVDALIQSSN